MKRIFQSSLYTIAAVLIILNTFCITKVFAANEDLIEYYQVDDQHSVIEFDTSEGPYYKINYNRKKIVSCTSDGAVIVKCTVNKNKLTLVLRSDERPWNTTYLFDLSNPKGQELSKDTIEYYKAYPSKKEIEFDTSQGPLYRINYAKKKILSCSSNKAKIKKCSVKGKILKLTVYSDEYPKDATYTFDLSRLDIIEYYRVFASDSVIEFDTENGPYYKIDYKKKKILACTSGNAVIRKCTVKANKLKLKVESNDFAEDFTYSFDLSKNVVTPGKLSVQLELYSYFTAGKLVYSIVNGEAIVTGYQKDTKAITIPASVQLDSWRFPVTGIAPDAFKGMKKLTSVIIGKNVTAIGKQAFQNCKKLKEVEIKTGKLTSKTIMAGAFKGIHAEAAVICPPGKGSAYKKILLKRGMEKTVKFQSYIYVTF